MVQLHPLLSTKFRSWLFRVFLPLGSLTVGAGMRVCGSWQPRGRGQSRATGAYKLLVGRGLWGRELAVCRWHAGSRCTAVANGGEEEGSRCAP